ncbi:MAG: PilZ domain-containing protein [Myxococcota bacterium]
MEKTNPDRRRLKIEAGDLLILHPEGPAGGYPMVVPVDHVDDDLHWFLGSCAPLGRGASLIVESPIQHDARYSTSATIAACSAATFALRISPIWERVQQRAFVRISAHGLQVRVMRPSQGGGDPIAGGRSPGGAAGATGTGALPEADPDREALHQLLDLSAGGIRFQSTQEYEADEEVVVHFELPGSECFVLSARVVRTPDMPANRTKNSVAVAFTGIDEGTRSQLLRWVYREQVRRHRNETRYKSGR